MRLLEVDSPLMQGMNRLGDLLWLNLLTLFCCIPVITVGPALTAMHYTALKIVRNEESYITRNFFKAFRKNLRQGIAVWLILLAVLLVLAGDFYIVNFSGLEFNSLMQIILMAAFLLTVFTAAFVFPVLAKFENTVFRTIKNAFLIGIMLLPRTVLMVILNALPLVLFVCVPHVIPIVFLFGLSAPAWLSARLYTRFFRKLEDKYFEENPPEQRAEGEDDRIFKDELDAALQNDSDIK